MRTGRPLIERVLEKIELDDSTGCWLWTGARNAKGYGAIKVDGSTKLAHRVAFELLVAPIGDGLELDHLCRTPACINPDHLEEVTGAENSRRGISANGSKTHCANGHEFTPENTIAGRNGRERKCLICTRAAQRRYKQRLGNKQGSRVLEAGVFEAVVA
jgi:hypothetical protein